MREQIKKMLKGCQRCLQFEGQPSKAPLCSIVAMTPLELVHVDFTTIETTLELNRPPKVVNALVIQDHITKYMMAYGTPNQMAKMVAKYLYQGYISVF